MEAVILVPIYLSLDKKIDAIVEERNGKGGLRICYIALLYIYSTEGTIVMISGSNNSHSSRSTSFSDIEKRDYTRLYFQDVMLGHILLQTSDSCLFYHILLQTCIL